MAAGAEHLKERVSEYCLSKRTAPKGDTFNGTLAGNWNEDRFDSRLVPTGGKRASLPTELDHTWCSTYATMNAEREAASKAAVTGINQRQLSDTTASLLDSLSGKNTVAAAGTTAAAARLSQQKLLDVVDGRHRAFPGHQPEQDLPGKDGLLPSELPASTVTRDSFIAPEEHRRRQQANAADVYYGPAHDKAGFTVFKVTQALQHRGVSARESVAAANAMPGEAAKNVRTNFSYPALRKALLAAERKPPVPGVPKRDAHVTQQELAAGLAAYGVPLEDAELVCFFKHLDRDGAGEVSVLHAVATIRGSMNDRRRGIVTRAFHLLEQTLAAKRHVPHGQAVAITLGDVLTYFDAAAHPDVRTGVHTADFVRKQLFEEYFSLPPGSQEAARRAIVTLEAFVELYQDWSALVAADHFFERAVRDTWHISGGTGLARNTSCRRVQVVHTNGRITHEEIQDDLGVADGDQAAMRANLVAQGITDVKTITVLQTA